MNADRAKKYAEELEFLVIKYAGIDKEAQALFDALGALIDLAKHKNISAPLDYQQVPGSVWFNEGSLRQYPDLEKAYVDFKVEITGGESDRTKDLLGLIEQFQSGRAGGSDE